MMMKDVIFIWMPDSDMQDDIVGDVVGSESHIAEVLKEGTDGSEDMSSERMY